MFFKVGFPVAIITLAVVALSLGGLGGNVQLSRFFLIALLPVILMRCSRIAKINIRDDSFYQLIFPILLMLIGMLSLAWSVGKLKSFGYLLVMLINLLPFIMLALMSKTEGANLRQLLPKAWLLAALVILPVALYELTTGDHFSLGLEQRGTDSFNILPFASGLHGNFNDFSLFLVLCAFGICLLDRKSSSTTWQVSAFIGLMLIAGVVTINGSRGAILTLVFLLIARFYKIIFSKSGALVLSACVVAYCVVLGGSVLNENVLVQYLSLKFTDFSNDLENDEGRYRIALAGVEGIIAYMGLGVGAGASSLYLESVRSVVIPNPHNLFLELGLNFGIPGLFLFLWFLARMWCSAWRLSIDEGRPVIICFFLLMPVFGLIQSHLTGYTYFWLAIATAAVFVSQREDVASKYRSVS
jgi:hypothetical protein